MTWRADTDTVDTSDSVSAERDGAHTERDTAELRVMAALAEVRKARHHNDCFCRRFDRQWCNAAEALWTRALERELSHLIPEQQQIGES